MGLLVYVAAAWLQMAPDERPSEGLFRVGSRVRWIDGVRWRGCPLPRVVEFTSGHNSTCKFWVFFTVSKPTKTGLFSYARGNQDFFSLFKATSLSFKITIVQQITSVLH